MIRSKLRFCLTLLSLLAASAAAASERTRLTVYTAIEPEQITLIGEAIAKALPDIELVWMRDSTGAVTDRLIAEAEAPRADLAYGIGASHLILLKRRGLLAPYRPKDVERLRAFFRDPSEPYAWTGMDAYLGAICFNTEAAANERVAKPVFWRDLLAPAFSGRIVMPDPNVSGTGMLLVGGWLQSMGEAKGWAFMDALDRNVSAYLPSGSTPCREAARGAALAGLSFDMRAATEKGKGAAIDIIVPLDGVGWEEEAVAILASSPHGRAAERVADWAASREANEIYAKSFAIVAYPGVANPSALYPQHAEARMIRNDLAWMADNRERILREWTRRYGAKTRPKP